MLAPTFGACGELDRSADKIASSDMSAVDNVFRHFEMCCVSAVWLMLAIAPVGGTIMNVKIVVFTTLGVSAWARSLLFLI